MRLTPRGEGSALERGLVRETTRRRRRPRVFSGATTGGTAATTETATSAAARTTGGLVDLGGGELEGRTDLVGLDLIDGALLAFLGLVRPLLEATLDHHPHAALQRLGHIFGHLPPDVDGEEQALAVLPFVGLAVQVARGRRDAELRDGRTTGG